MIKSFYIFDDIIESTEQEKIESFICSDAAVWTPISNITGEFGGNIKENHPAELIYWNSVNDEILSIVSKIEKKSIEKIGFDFVKNFRQKINKTFPIGNYDPNKLMHVDMNENHVSIIYYINDCDGDTILFNNKRGNNAESSNKSFYSIDINDFKILEKVTPKKGRVLIFDGNIYHYGEYPTKGNRYVINYNTAVKPKVKNIL